MKNNLFSTMLGFRLSRFFSIKCLMIVHPYILLLISGSIVAFMFAMILRISDGPIIDISEKAQQNQLNFKPISNALWVALVSMTTVGYGDIYPLTNLGRFIVVVCAVLGTIIVSLMVISLQNSLQFNASEERAYNLKREIDLKLKVQRKSVEYFMSQYKFMQLKTKYEKMLRDNDMNERKLKKTKLDLIESLYKKLQKKKDFKFVKRYYEIYFSDYICTFENLNEIDSLVGYLEENMKLISEDIDNTRLISSSINDMFRSVNIALKYSMVDYSNVMKKRDRSLND